MTAPSKIKGSAFERECASVLNKLFSTTHFARAPGSGAMFGKSNATRASTSAQHNIDALCGDISTPIDFPYSIECKSYGAATGPNFYNVVSGSDRVLDKWINQAELDAKTKNKLPLLLIKITRKGTFFVIREQYHYPVPYMRYFSNDVPYGVFNISQLNDIIGPQ